jgi:phenylpyruvate tautomerase PptA (4-oxalocrotonate tautomerase family)
MKGWIYEVAEDADYNAGRPDHEKPFYFLEIRIPKGRLDLLPKQGPIRDFTKIMLDAKKSDDRRENGRRVSVTINEIACENWGVGGHTDWLRDYTSALDEIGENRRSP